MEQLAYLVVGAVLTWTFYFIQRRVERRATTDAIDRSQKLLGLKQAMDTGDVDVDELRAFEQRLIGKAETAVAIADGYVTQAEEAAQRRYTELMGQDAMLQRALLDYQRVDAKLDRLLVHLRLQLDADTRRAFDESHRAWLVFRERHARFVADSYAGGGSVRPLIHATTLESLTSAYSAELQTQLGQ